MAKHVLIICDLGDRFCKGEVQHFKVWRTDDAVAHGLDVCEYHAKPLVEMFALASDEPLPARPRMRMEPTKLKITKDTRHLKRQK